MVRGGVRSVAGSTFLHVSIRTAVLETGVGSGGPDIAISSTTAIFIDTGGGGLASHLSALEHSIRATARVAVHFGNTALGDSFAAGQNATTRNRRTCHLGAKESTMRARASVTVLGERFSIAVHLSGLGISASGRELAFAQLFLFFFSDGSIASTIGKLSNDVTTSVGSGGSEVDTFRANASGEHTTRIANVNEVILAIRTFEYLSYDDEGSAVIRGS